MLEKIFNKHDNILTNKINSLAQKLETLNSISYQGRVNSATGAIVIATFPQAKIGDLCIIENSNIDFKNYAEVVAINEDEVKLLPFGSIEQISSQAVVSKASANFTININSHILGKVVDGLGNIVSSMLENEIYSPHEQTDTQSYHVMRLAPDALSRKIIEEPLYTGIKAIDLFTTCGKGQRLAIFAGPGMGKTTLMGMIIKYSKADVIVVALIGERGREVREFIELELDEKSRKKCVLVVVTSDRPPVEQVKAAYTAHTIAEYFRDQNLDVLLFTDSITRFARAQREVGLSAGEPITRGGYPPSVFLAFPRLMERAGNAQNGSITAFYTVLMEGEQTNQDPIADEIKSIVDGHIILSRKLVETGHFPAINILASLSRVADRIIDEQHKLSARKIRLLLSKYEELEFLLRVGEYKRGNDSIADEAIDKHSTIMEFLKQHVDESEDFTHMLEQLHKII